MWCAVPVHTDMCTYIYLYKYSRAGPIFNELTSESECTVHLFRPMLAQRFIELSDIFGESRQILKNTLTFE